jgi:hypothetical protein
MRKFLFVIALSLLCSNVTADAPIKNNFFCLMLSVNRYTESQDTYAEETEALEKKLSKSISSLYSLEEKMILRKECNYKNCLEGFEWLKKCKANDVALVYVGCHGSTRGGYYSILIEDKRLYGSEVKEYLEKLPCKVILIIDTCHSGAMIEEWKDSNDKISIICSCGSTEDAYCWQLSQALMDAISGKADYNNDGFIDLAEIRKYVVKQVPELSGKQHPVLSEKSPLIRIGKKL